jgi:hypothetical protein
LFSNTLSPCSSLNIRDQVSHPYKTTGKIIVLYIQTFTFLDSTNTLHNVTNNMELQLAILSNKPKVWNRWMIRRLKALTITQSMPDISSCGMWKSHDMENWNRKLNGSNKTLSRSQMNVLRTTDSSWEIMDVWHTIRIIIRANSSRYNSISGQFPENCGQHILAGILHHTHTWTGMAYREARTI